MISFSSTDTIDPYQPRHQKNGFSSSAVAARSKRVLLSSFSPPQLLLKSVLLSYTYMGIWIRLSFSVIVYNKYILDPKMYDWPFPVSLTMIHMAFCASLTAVLVRVVDTPTLPPMMPGLYAAYVIPIGVLYALSLSGSLQFGVHLPLRLLHPDAPGTHARRRLLPRRRPPH
jgi:hypothetical protein